MSGQWIATVGNQEQVRALMEGPSLRGRREPRVALVGRSNVGKSSLVNALLDTRLAQVSAEPGKTRLIHFYHWKEGEKVVVDLPGYGFARASQQERNKWAALIEAYLRAERNLQTVLMLFDARNGPTEIDREAHGFLKSLGMHVSVAFTKTDGLKTQRERAERKRDATAAIEEMGIDPASVFWVCSHNGDNMNLLVNYLRDLDAEAEETSP